eukprot:TRINITY_DN13319_c0_g1_i2.p1 TRINITY_DN13319_c0_g1~~TRINITY_DN13319_c0_g1_i2.p1  ORF type:complete len:235 (+),score=41.61 TRINITY_DN13319_c0_g1_i2:200-904(+)
MSIAIGTSNPGKLQAVRDALAPYPKLNNKELVPLTVDSGVSDQPASLEETTRGAANRAKAALSKSTTATLGIGMESGLFDFGDKTFDLCACVIWDGENEHVGFSCAWELPLAVRDKFKNQGKNLTDAFNELNLCADSKIGDKGGVLAVVTGNRMTRPQYTVQSIQMALVSLAPGLYQCSKAVPMGVNDPNPIDPVEPPPEGLQPRSFWAGAMVGASTCIVAGAMLARICWQKRC